MTPREAQQLLQQVKDAAAARKAAADAVHDALLAAGMVQGTRAFEDAYLMGIQRSMAFMDAANEEAAADDAIIAAIMGRT